MLNAPARHYEKLRIWWISPLIVWIVLNFIVIVPFCFKSPWIIPFIIIISGLSTFFISNKSKTTTGIKKPIFKWGFSIAFISIFLLVGILSETARKNQWKNRKAINLLILVYHYKRILVSVIKF